MRTVFRPQRVLCLALVALVVACQAPLVSLLSRCRGIDRLVAQDGSLPPFDVYAPLLSLPGLLGTSLATVQKTLTGLWAGIRHAANPGSLDFLPVSERTEDHATMALGVAEKLGDAIEKARYLVAIELLIAAQAIDLRDLDRNRLGAGARIAYERVRAAIPALDVDRPLGPDIDRIEALVRAGDFNAP